MEVPLHSSGKVDMSLHKSNSQFFQSKNVTESNHGGVTAEEYDESSVHRVSDIAIQSIHFQTSLLLTTY